MKTCADIDHALADYELTAQSSEQRDNVAMSDWYDLFPEEHGGDHARFAWPQNFPNAGKAGVYFVFDASEQLLYIGQSGHDVQSRLGRYFGYLNGRGSSCKIKDISPPWKARPRFVRTIATHSREAEILERFLIDRLQPPENTVGLRKLD